MRMPTLRKPRRVRHPPTWFDTPVMCSLCAECDRSCSTSQLICPVLPKTGGPNNFRKPEEGIDVAILDLLDNVADSASAVVEAVVHLVRRPRRLLALTALLLFTSFLVAFLVVIGRRLVGS